MPRAYSLDLRQRLIDAVEAGSSARAAAKRLQVSASTAVKWVQRKRETGSVEATPMHGHPPAKLLPHKDRLLRLVADLPDLTLRRIGDRLAADGIHVSKSCLHTFLWRNRIRLKKDRSRPKIQPWIDPDRLVFLDGEPANAIGPREQAPSSAICRPTRWI